MKLLVLLCGEDDEKLQIAAAGGLAMITAAEKKLCVKMTKVVCTMTHVKQTLGLGEIGGSKNRSSTKVILQVGSVKHSQGVLDF